MSLSLGEFKRFADIEDPVVRARELMIYAHQGQTRAGGQPYDTHPTEVERIVRDDWGVRVKEIQQAALLHDVVEDTRVGKNDIQGLFGEEVTTMVVTVTNLKEGTDGDNTRRLLAANDNLGLVIKLADRLHNLRTIGPMPVEKQARKGEETLRTIVPIATSLGMRIVGDELADRSFELVNPTRYELVKDLVTNDPRMDESFQLDLKQHMADMVSPVYVATRLGGSLWNIDKKLQEQLRTGRGTDRDVSSIDDLVKWTVCLPTEEECFRAAHEISKNFAVDYTGSISGSYRALGLTLNWKEQPVHVELTTPRSDDFNQRGILNLLGEETADVKKINDKFPISLVVDRDYKVHALKPGSKAADLAGKISPHFLSSVDSAEINGTLMPLTTTLTQGDRVVFIEGELQTTKDLYSAVNTMTKEQLREIEAKRYRDKLLVETQNKLESLLAKYGVFRLGDLPAETQRTINHYFGKDTTEELIMSVGINSILAEKLDEIIGKSSEKDSNKKLCSVRLRGNSQVGVTARYTNVLSRQGYNIAKVVHITNGSEFVLYFILDNADPMDVEKIHSSMNIEECIKVEVV